MSFQTDIKSTGDFQKEIVEVPGTLQGGDSHATSQLHVEYPGIGLACADIHTAHACKEARIHAHMPCPWGMGLHEQHAHGVRGFA